MSVRKVPPKHFLKFFPKVPWCGLTTTAANVVHISSEGNNRNEMQSRVKREKS